MLQFRTILLSIAVAGTLAACNTDLKNATSINQDLSLKEKCVRIVRQRQYNRSNHNMDAAGATRSQRGGLDAAYDAYHCDKVLGNS